MDEDNKNQYYKQIIEQLNSPQSDYVDESSGEYEIDPNEIDINDYIPANEYQETADNEFKQDINILNILTYYYKQVHEITEKISLFDGIEANTNDMTATNKAMEWVYAEIFRYEKSDKEDKDVLYNPDDEINFEAYTELYCLMINDEPVYACSFILPLVMYLNTIQWLELDWDIVNLI